METGLKQQPVDEVIIEKIMRFAQSHETFTTKELFEAYPNNPELILRYGINNLRIEKKIFMFGNKRGAYYSCKQNPDIALKEEVDISASSLRDIVLNKVKTMSGWFQTPALGLNETLGHVGVLKTLRELIEDNTIVTRGAKRWTEYRLNDGSSVDAPVKQDKQKPESQPETGPKNNDLKNKILHYIKKNKVVTIPMVVEEFELQRYVILPIVQELEQEEEIWHEGIKKASKYVYKDTPANEVEQIVNKLIEERRIEQQNIDDLSEFLCREDSTCISVGFDSDGTFKMKFFVNGSKQNEKDFTSIQDGLSFVKEMTTVKNGQS